VDLFPWNLVERRSSFQVPSTVILKPGFLCKMFPGNKRNLSLLANRTAVEDADSRVDHHYGRVEIFRLYHIDCKYRLVK